MTGNASDLFIVHRWNNPQTTSDYPFLALAADCSTLLSIGNYGLGFDWELPDEAQLWLEDDFAPTGEVFDLVPHRRVLTPMNETSYRCGWSA